jgi:hypothetical protein
MPPADLALKVHRLQRARLALAQAEAELRATGVDPRQVDRALALQTAEPREIAAEAAAVGVYLDAIGAPVRLELVELFERIAEQTHEESLRSAQAAGRLAAVLCQPRDGGGRPEGSEELQSWRAGFDDFAVEVAASRTRA